MVLPIHSICLKGPAQVVFARIYISLGKYSHSRCDVSFAQYMFTDPQVLGWRQPRYTRPHRKQRQISITAYLTPYNNLEPCHLPCRRSALLWSRLPTITSGGAACLVHRNCLGHESIQRSIAMAERWQPTLCSEHG